MPSTRSWPRATTVDAEGGDDTDLVTALAQGIFSERFFADLQHRRAMWQLMLGGVFDRHPNLKLMMAEVRADWLPETLAHLDAVYDEHRADLASRRKPSDWWESNCLAGVSFMHKAEIEIRDEIGVDHMTFGRDYPHAEGTWPNTVDYLRDLFAGVPETDVRKILGENAIRFFGLDAEKIAAHRAAGRPDNRAVDRRHVRHRPVAHRPPRRPHRLPQAR